MACTDILVDTSNVVDYLFVLLSQPYLSDCSGEIAASLERPLLLLPVFHTPDQWACIASSVKITCNKILRQCGIHSQLLTFFTLRWKDNLNVPDLWNIEATPTSPRGLFLKYIYSFSYLLLNSSLISVYPCLRSNSPFSVHLTCRHSIAL